ncbi:MAG: CHRD domain-containing protein [Candidatus Eisenbacteria bacterium]
MNRTRFAIIVLLLAAFAGSLSPGASEARRGSNGGSQLQLTPDAVVPSQGEFGASAQATVTTSRSEVCFQVTIGSLSGYITTIGIHEGAMGANGPMVVRLSPSPIGINQLMGCVPVDTALARDISRNPTHYYIQIRTTVYPDGAVRAQLER